MGGCSFHVPCQYSSPPFSSRQEVGDNEVSPSEGGRHSSGRTPTPEPAQPTATTTTTKKTSSQPAKLVDLGAAATFASQAAAKNQRKEPAGSSTIDTVFGDFSSQPTATHQPPPPVSGTLTISGGYYVLGICTWLCCAGGGGEESGFADFEGAFGGTNNPTQPTAVGTGDKLHCSSRLVYIVFTLWSRFW